MSETSGGLPLMAQTQNSRYLTYNEAMWAINVLQTGVLDRDLTAPPGSPSEGDAYIVNGTATGSWAGHEDDIAFYFGSIWNFLEPELAQGNGVYVVDEDLRVRWNGSAYVLESSSEATTIAYTPGPGSSWGSPEPTTVAEALDEASQSGGGDASTNTATSVDSEIALFSGTGGKTLKRATGTGFVRVASGVMSSVDGSNDDFAQRKSGVWTNRTAAQAATDLQADGLDADAAGFRGVPQNAQTGNYTLVAADAGKHIYHASGAGSGDTYTIPANSSVAFEVGTAVTFINLATDSVTIAITTDTMNLAGAGTTGSRTLAQYGIATAVKVTSTSWLISGTNLT